MAKARSVEPQANIKIMPDEREILLNLKNDFLNASTPEDFVKLKYIYFIGFDVDKINHIKTEFSSASSIEDIRSVKQKYLNKLTVRERIIFQSNFSKAVSAMTSHIQTKEKHTFETLCKAEFTYSSLEFIDYISVIYGNLIERNKSKPPNPRSVFHGKSGSKTVKEFLNHLLEHGENGIYIQRNLVDMMIYLDRYLVKVPEEIVNINTIHRLLLTAFMLSFKHNEDEFYVNKHYAIVGGLSSTKEINNLEIEFLMSIGFELKISNEQFLEYKNILIKGLDSRFKNNPSFNPTNREEKCSENPISEMPLVKSP